MEKKSTFFSRVWQWVRALHCFILEHPKWLEISLVAVGAMAVVVQLTTVSAVLFQSADSRAVVASRDDDSAAGIGDAEETYLINDNGVRLYGPVYYRISSIFRYFGVNHYGEGYSDQEHKERSIYFHLMLINLLCLYLGSYLLLTLLTQRVSFQLLGTWALVAAFLQNEQRSLLLFMAKPDHALNLFICLALVLTWTCLQKGSQNRQALRWMAFGWALAASTKLTTILFFPSLLFVIYRRSKTEWFSDLKFFGKWLAIFYFAIGFPQNFDILRNISYLLQQNAHTSPVTWDFLKNQWLHLFSLDLGLPTLTLALLALIFFFDKEWTEFRSGPNTVRMGLIFLLSTLILVSKQTKTPFQWYTFPFTAAGLVFVILILKNISSFVFPKALAAWRKRETAVYYPIFAFFLVPALVHPFPDRVFKTYLSHQVCRNEARTFEVQVNSRAEANKVILAEPYIPYSRKYHDHQVRMSYDMSLELLERIKPDVIALKKNYYQIYLPQEEGGTGQGALQTADKNSTAGFYRLFFNKSETLDPSGQKWKKVYSDPCSFELWEKIP